MNDVSDARRRAEFALHRSKIGRDVTREQRGS